MERKKQHPSRSKETSALPSLPSRELEQTAQKLIRQLEFISASKNPDAHEGARHGDQTCDSRFVIGHWLALATRHYVDAATCLASSDRRGFIDSFFLAARSIHQADWSMKGMHPGGPDPASLPGLESLASITDLFWGMEQSLLENRPERVRSQLALALTEVRKVFAELKLSQPRWR